MRAISSSVLLVGLVVGFVSWYFVLGAVLPCARLRISIRTTPPPVAARRGVGCSVLLRTEFIAHNSVLV